MEATPGLEAKEKPAAGRPAAPPADRKEQIRGVMKHEPHRAYAAEDLARVLKLQFPKDPQKQAEALKEITSHLHKLIEESEVTEVSQGVFKTRLFFDEEKNIEHAFIGGMGNTHYRFAAPIFRLNLGVLSLYFIHDKREGNWWVTIKDTTIGKDYSLTRRLQDGVHLFGSRPPQAGEENYLQIEGKYIAKNHGVIKIAGEQIQVEDHNTLNGTRIDFLTKEGLTRYRQAAGAFLKGVDPKAQRDPIARGRFALDQLIQHHQNLEITFFNAVVDSLLLERV
ncbi:MAG TPA: FHA domain-containing protein [Candidatus Manganitrophaceae bacterium]|nr:FHA domain-containing protein [Candidatus Manganitrophaceae bacterium]